jgi:hypothetical protein
VLGTDCRGKLCSQFALVLTLPTMQTSPTVVRWLCNYFVCQTERSKERCPATPIECSMLTAVETLRDALQQAAVWCEDLLRDLHRERELRQQQEVSAICFRCCVASHTSLPTIPAVSFGPLMPGCSPAHLVRAKQTGRKHSGCFMPEGYEAFS